MHTCQNAAVMVAIGANEGGYREVIGCTEGFTESKECWRSFLSWLKSRGLRGARMLTGDKAHRKAEISCNTAYSYLAKDVPTRLKHPPVSRSRSERHTHATRQSQCLQPEPTGT